MSETSFPFLLSFLDNNFLSTQTVFFKTACFNWFLFSPLTVYPQAVLGHSKWIFWKTKKQSTCYIKYSACDDGLCIVWSFFFLKRNLENGETVKNSGGVNLANRDHTFNHKCTVTLSLY